MVAIIGGNDFAAFKEEHLNILLNCNALLWIWWLNWFSKRDGTDKSEMKWKEF